ncbi:MAG: mucoidy inhibitor MuiA family protein [Rhodospirillales bacterium]|nr:mucoidy inhibitor MuiA family protein [Alphaproteobacteria bacterium]MCB1838871.1 mucoidy inhibitor MuiA family protein [Alphaproteobacteria bacterium]MCB9977004.1 mucoidy inhibitor MuiA family protein [Rhodospirillales bacterium]
MRYSIRFLLSGLVLSFTVPSFPAFADDIRVESTIKSATVYNDRATVTRMAKVEIPAGSHNLIFSGLPIKLYPNSLRVSGTSDARVVFGALTSKLENSEEFVVASVLSMKDRLDLSQGIIKGYKAEQEALSEANNMLKTWSMQAGSPQTNSAPSLMDLKPDQWIAASDGLSAKILANLKAKLALDQKISEENDRIRKINQDLKQFQADYKQSYTVTIPFESDKNTTLNVALSYQVSHVGWVPMYDARLDVQAKTLEFVQYGSVWQRSGEDWKDVELVLSTAQPSRGTALPELQSRWLSLYKPQASPAYVQAVEERNEADFEKAIKTGDSAIPVPLEAPSDRLQLPGAADDGEDPLHRWRRLQEERVLRKADTQAVVSNVNASGYVGEYKVTGPATVPSDGAQAKLLIGQFGADVGLQVQIKPQISDDAYMVATFKLKGDSPVLPGLLSLFRDGAFIGQDQVRSIIRPGEEAEMSFGVDDAVVVKRNVLKDEAREVGLITTDSVLEKNFINEIQNLHKQDIQIAVLEIVPVSGDERVRIDILRDKTTPGFEKDFKNVKGATRWVKVLKPQQKEAIKLGWSVSWPKDENLSGL